MLNDSAEVIQIKSTVSKVYPYFSLLNIIQRCTYMVCIYRRYKTLRETYAT